MAKAPAGLGIAAAAVGLWFLLREVKSIKLPDFSPSLFEIGSGGPITIQTKGIDTLLEERTEDLQLYEAERTGALASTEQTRAQAGLIAGNYGTIPSGITGSWHPRAPAGADRCYIITATGAASNTTRFYTGKYCREAQTAGFISPFSGEAI